MEASSEPSKSDDLFVAQTNAEEMVRQLKCVIDGAYASLEWEKNTSACLGLLGIAQDWLASLREDLTHIRHLSFALKQEAKKQAT